MVAARNAAHRIEHADPETSPGNDPTLALARATRSVTNIIAAENRVADGRSPEAERPRQDDARHLTLRQLLFPLAREPDPTRRNALRRRISAAIDDALDLELDDEDAPLADIALVIARQLGLPFNLAKVSDSVLKMSTRRPSPGQPPLPHPEIDLLRPAPPHPARQTAFEQPWRPRDG